MRRLLCSTFALMAFLLPGLCMPSMALAQGVLINVNVHEHVALPRPIVIHTPRVVPIPQPPVQGTYKIKELSVQVKLQDQVAKTQVTQSFVNTGSTQMEVCFVFPLPYDGAVDQLTLLIDGKEFPAKLLPAEEARKMYEDIVRKNQDPALLEWMGAGMFKTSVFPVPPGAERKVSLRYSQLCRKNHGLTDFVFPLSTAKYTSHPVEKVDLQVSIESAADIKNVYSPSHTVDIKRPDGKHANISYTGKDEIPATDFRLLYDVGQGQVGASVITYRPDSSDEGYFLLLASPEIKAPDQERPKKNVILVCDRSGSMQGAKFEQAKGALKFVLNNLREGDLFNVVAYDSQIESFRPELQKFDEETRKAALGFVEGLYAGGSTNISGAMQTGLGYLKDSSRPNYVIFLTDGLPTDGETNESKIVAAAKANNLVRARVFAFGVGYDVNSRLLDKLVRENFGQSEYVRPNENIEAKVSSLYARIGSPVMTDVSIKYDFDSAPTEQGPAVNRTYPGQVTDLFAGEQLSIVGRYKKHGAAKITIAGKVGDKEQKLDFPAAFVEKSSDQTNVFIERLWAMRRVGEILDQIDLKGKNDELVKELVQLSTKHGILTPYTSFIADENANHRDLARNYREAQTRLGALDQADGLSGVAQRAAKGALQRAENAPSSSSGGISNFAAGRGAGAARYRSLAEDKEVDVTTVLNVGGKTFLRRGNRWVDAKVSEEQEKKAIQVKRFSDEYFNLVKKHGKDAATYMNFDEPVCVEIAGQAYEF